MKKITGLLFVLIVINQNILSQNKINIDSLIHVYNNQALDTLKIKTVNTIINYYMYRSKHKARKYAYEQLKLSNELKYKKGRAMANYQLGIIYNNLDAIDSAKYYYNTSLKISKQLNNPILISKAYRGFGILEFSQGNLDAADSINDLDFKNAFKFKDTMGMALSYDFKGNIYQNKGYYSIALENVLKGFELFELLGDSIRLADSYNHLATIENSLQNFRNAISFNEKALAIYRLYNDVHYEASVLNDLGIMYMKLFEEQKAIDYYNKSIERNKIANVKSLEAATYGNIGAAYIQLKDYTEAIKYLNKSINLSKTINANRRIAIVEVKLANAYLEMKQPIKTIKHANNAKKYTIKNENINIEASAEKYLSLANEALGNFEKSLTYHKKFKLLNDSIVNKEKIIKIEELRAKFDLKAKESEIALQEKEIKNLNIQAKNDRLTKTLYGIGMFSFFTISGLFYFGFKQRIKRNKIEREKQEEIYKQEIEFKKKELTSQTLHLVQKNTFIQELRENLEKIKNSPDLFKVEFRRLVMLLKKESAEDKDWEVFKSYFSEVHNNFDLKLKNIYANITEKEIRLASFLRMNLSTKEIASMLNVLPDSILKSKYRLKKKLNLEKNVDLNAFLNNL